MSNVRYWANGGASNWNSPANWAYTSGAPGGAPVPGVSDTAIFDGVAGHNGQANVDVAVNVASLTFSGYTGALNTQGFAISISSSLTLGSGTITLTTNTLSVGGDLIRSAGVAFNAGSSTVTLTGAQNQTINIGTATVFNLFVNKTGGTATLASAFTSTGSLTLSAGTLDTSPSNWSVTVASNVVINGGTLNLNASTMSVARDWTNSNGTFTAGTSTVNFIGGSTETITTGGDDFYNLTVNKTAATLFNVNDTLNVDGIWTQTNGTLNSQGHLLNIGGNTILTGGIWNLGTSSVTVGGNFTRTATTFNANASTVAFTGNASQAVDNNGSSFFDVEINNNGGTVNLARAFSALGSLVINNGTIDTTASNWSVTVASAVVINNGTFNLNASTMSLQRDWDFNGGTFNAGNSTVTFTGSNTQNITSNGSSFTNLAINKAALSVVVQDPLDINGTFTNTLGTFNTNTQPVSVGGNWNFTAGTFTGTGSTVTFNNPTFSTLSGATTFYALHALTPNTTLYFTAGTTQYVTGSLDLENISLRSTTNNATWYFRYNGLSQTVLDVAVQDSNANLASTIFADAQSSNAGNNHNWVFGANSTRYWVSAISANWNSTANWSYASAGSSGAPVPASTDTVVFDGVGGFSGQANVNVAVNIGALTLSGYTGTLNTQGFSVTVASAVTQNSGTITLTTNTMSVGGDIIRSAGTTFNVGASTLALTGAQNQTINLGTATIFNLFVNKTGGATATLAAALTSTGSLVLSGGTFDTGSNWSVTVTSNVVINGGTFNLNNSTMSVLRDWTLSSGVINADGSTVTFTGANATQNITLGGDNFFNIAINKSAGSVVLQDPFDADGSFTNTLGTFNTNSKSLSIGGNWNFAAGTYTGAGSTVTFNSPTQSTLSGSTTFYALSALTPHTTLYFTAGSTQYVTGSVDLENIALRSTTNNATWYFRYNGSSQTLLGLIVQDSNASSGLQMSADATSVNAGNNTNWNFGGAPNAINNLAANQSATGAAIDLSWTAPGANGSVGTLFNSTFTIQYTTDTVFAQSASWSPINALPADVFRLNIATDNVAAGSNNVATISGLISGGTYYFRAWTENSSAIYSPISNGATNWATTLVLGVALSTDSIQFGSLTAGTTNVISSSITVTNTGNVAQRYSLYIDTPAIWVPTTGGAGLDSFRLSSVFKNALPVSADFSSANDVVTGSTTTASSTTYARDADPDSEKGINVLPGATRSLWFQIEMPPVSSTATEQVIRLHATASQ